MPTNSDPSEPLPGFKASDLRKLAGLMVTAPLSWMTPECLWKIYTFPGAFFKACIFFNHTRNRLWLIKSVMGSRITIFEAFLIEIHALAGEIERNFQYFREFSPKGWRPKIRIVGREYIDEALKSGKGGILWVAPFIFNQLVVKKGLREAGLGISHLGAYPHGQSVTRFGIRFINPIRAKPENSYLDERIIISPRGGKLGYIRKVERRLRENGLVSITCRNLAEKMIELPILNGKIRLASGPPSFALATKAALLPVFTIYKASGKYEIIIEPPLDLPETENRDEAVELLTTRYVKLMESYLVNFPFLFNHWPYLRRPSNSVASKKAV